MKNQELFDKTVAILVKAYFEGVLEYGDPCCCAVGNMVAANMGYKIIIGKPAFHYKKPDNEFTLSHWGIPMYYSVGRESVIEHLCYGDARKEINSTGYTVFELSDIEKAFHDGTQYVADGTTKQEENFNGLMSVVDCLMQIHEATPEQTKAAKELFTTTA